MHPLGCSLVVVRFGCADFVDVERRHVATGDHCVGCGTAIFVLGEEVLAEAFPQRAVQYR